MQKPWPLYIIASADRLAADRVGIAVRDWDTFIVFPHGRGTAGWRVLAPS
ncbi:MAG: hypothetical protein Q4P15_05525 [Propionibacteriaceae bacterium]|nr:hypothetical protein [Propionibacteriaceae bacterium]